MIYNKPLILSGCYSSTDAFSDNTADQISVLSIMARHGYAK